MGKTNSNNTHADLSIWSDRTSKKYFLVWLLALICASTVMFAAPKSTYADVRNISETCTYPPTKRVYTETVPRYWGMTVYSPLALQGVDILWDKDRDKQGAGAVQTQVVPDHQAKRLYWTIYYNPIGRAWQKPYFWFTLQNNVRITSRIEAQNFFNSDVILFSKNFENIAVAPQDWGPKQNDKYDFFYDFKKGPLDYTNDNYWLGLHNQQYLGRFLIQDFWWLFTPVQEKYYNLPVDYKGHLIDGIPVGDLFAFKSIGGANMAGEGVATSVRLTFTTTMPDNEGEPVSLYAGVRSYQNNEIRYVTTRNTIKAPELAPVTYTLAPSPKDETDDGYILKNLPLEGLMQNPFKTLDNASELTKEQREIIAWIMYLGYPFDNSEELSNFFIMANNALSEENLKYMEHYGDHDVNVSSMKNPLRDYYHTTQEAIWKVVDDSIEFTIPNYDYEVNGETYQSRYPDAGPRLLKMAKDRYQQFGPLKEYLRRIGKSDMQGYLYDLPEDKHGDNFSRVFLKLDSTCKELPQKVSVEVNNRDQNSKRLNGSKFNLYKGSISTEQLKDLSKLTPVNTEPILSEDGVVYLDGLDAHSTYTLVQLSAPDEDYTLADPIVFTAYPSITANVFKPKTEVKPTDTILDFSDFTRIYMEEGNVFLLTFDPTQTGKLGAPTASKNILDKLIKLPDGSMSYIFPNGFDMINQKLDLKPQVTGFMKIGETEAEFDLDKNSGSSINTNLVSGFFSKQPVSAKIHYKGLNPNVDYHMISQLYKFDEATNSYTRVGNYVDTPLTSATMKETIPGIENGKYTQASMDYINRFDKDKYLEASFGKVQLETGKYYVASTFVTDKQLAQAKETSDPMGYVERLAASQDPKVSKFSTPFEFSPLMAQVTTAPLTALDDITGSREVSYGVIAAPLVAFLGAATCFITKRRKKLNE